MTVGSIPIVVQTLLYEHIESYEQLQILLLLRLESTENWTTERISDRLNLRAPLVVEALAPLTAVGLIRQREEWSRYEFAPRTADLDDAVTQLALAYSVQQLEVVKLMSANAVKRMRTNALKAFSDAFILHKDGG